MSDAARELLDEFNEGNWDEVGSYFNDDFSLFLDYLEKNERIEENTFNGRESGRLRLQMLWENRSYI